MTVGDSVSRGDLVVVLVDGTVTLTGVAGLGEEARKNDLLRVILSVLKARIATSPVRGHTESPSVWEWANNK